MLKNPMFVTIFMSDQDRPSEGIGRQNEPGTAPSPIFLESDDLAKEFEMPRTRGVTFGESEPTAHPFGVGRTALNLDGSRLSLRQPARG